MKEFDEKKGKENIETTLFEELEKRIMKTLDDGFNSILKLFDGYPERLKIATSEKSTGDRVYVPLPDYQPPVEEFPIISRGEAEKNEN